MEGLEKEHNKQKPMMIGDILAIVLLLPSCISGSEKIIGQRKSIIKPLHQFFSHTNI